MAIADLGMSQPGKSLQRERRGYHDAFVDQHNRHFAADFEKENGRPIGELKPVGFNPPWLPPMRFIKWEREGSFRFRWDYDAMADELSGMTASYYQDAIKFAIENNKPEPEVGGPVDRTIRAVLGQPPMSPAIPLAASMGNPWMLGVPGAPVDTMLKAVLEQHIGANGKEALEYIRAQLRAKQSEANIPLVPTVPETPEPAVKVKSINDPEPFDPGAITYSEFVKACAGRKMKMPDIVAAWNEHKANLAAEAAA